jgi:hypothetical protein
LPEMEGSAPVSCTGTVCPLPVPLFGNKPFCDGTHAKIHFDGTETAGNEAYLRHPKTIEGPSLKLEDVENLFVHARFCMRAGGIWNLIRKSGIPEARETAIEEVCNCPSGRLVVRDRETGDTIEPEHWRGPSLS